MLKKLFPKRKKKNLSGTFSLIPALAVVCLCMGWTHYQPMPLLSSSLLAVFDPKEKILDIQVKVLSPEESKTLLGHNLPGKEIQPLYLTIHNNTPHTYTLDPEAIDLNQIDSKTVAKKLKRSAFPRSIGFKVLGYFFWPFMLPGSIDSIHTFRSYKNLKKDYAAKAIKEETIPVYSMLHRIVFVPLADVKEEFTVTLHDTQKSRPYVFSLSTGQQKVQPQENQELS
ncbi:MAG TPA: hypothetical protein VGJ00_02635 [Rhabdochlamydiaceae bacterium]